MLVAVAAGAFVLLRQPGAEPTRTPEETVREFLAAVFLAESPERVAAVICDSWAPADAIERTSAEIPRSVRVSWDEFAVVTSDTERMTMRARLGLRQSDDLRPGSYAQWRFHLRQAGRLAGLRGPPVPAMVERTLPAVNRQV